MVEESTAEDVALDTEQAEDPVQEAIEPSDEAAARLRALIDSSAERWARRIARAGRVDEKDLAMIAQSLAVPVDRVSVWAQASVSMDEPHLCQSLKSLGMTP
jgi:Fe-S cluster assembly iron-binding protein IscA